MSLVERIEYIREGETVDLTYRVTAGKDGFIMYGGRVVADAASAYLDPSIVGLRTVYLLDGADVSEAEPWACPECFRDAVEIGFLASGYSVIFFKDAYHLLGGQGHNGDILITFTSPPQPDPDPDEAKALALRGSDEEAEKVLHAGIRAWINTAEEEMSRFPKSSLQDSYYVTQDMMDAGFDREEDGFLELWMYNRIGLLVSEFEKSGRK